MERWQDEAACSGLDTELFYNPFATVQAKAVCAGCPVARQCGEYAVKHEDAHGVWGGQTADDRGFLQVVGDPDEIAVERAMRGDLSVVLTATEMDEVLTRLSRDYTDEEVGVIVGVSKRTVVRWRAGDALVRTEYRAARLSGRPSRRHRRNRETA